MSNELDLTNLNSPEDLQKVFDQISAGDTPSVIEQPEQAQTTEQVKPKDEPAQDTRQQAEQGQADTEDGAAGVATKDGKHVIPYSVLTNARERATRAEQIAREAQERAEALEAQLKSGSQGAKDGESARTEQTPAELDIPQEDLEALKTDFPTVYKAVMASMAAAKALEAQLKPVAESVQTQEAERARSATESVQEAIDSIPKLAFIQATDKQTFELAKQFDATLRAQPAWANKSLSDRFAKVTEMVESAVGEIKLPASKQPSLSAEQLSKAAREKAAKAAKDSSTNVPTSLSEFPAGQAAAESEVQAVEQMTHDQLATKFAKMSPEQMDAYFKSL